MRISTSMGRTTGTGTIITATAMLTDTGLNQLLAWSSPSYPIGAFSYSHGLETAVDSGEVRTAPALADYVEAVLARGGGWTDAVLFAHAHRAAHDPQAFDDIAELAAAFRATSETALEARQQGYAFLKVTRAAWPHVALDNFADRSTGKPVAHAAAAALAAAVHGVALRPALAAFLHGIAANLVSAGVRLVPLGQTDGQIALARLAPVIEAVTDAALGTPLDDLGTAAPLLEFASMAHETLYTRLFRS
jgi:urease accessory protein